MAFQELMGLSNRLLTDAQALAALTARLRLDELGVEGDPAVGAQLDRVVDALGAREHVEGLDEGERSVVLSFARSYLAQALDLVEDPGRAGSWSYADPVLLQAQGSASAVVARLIADAGLGSANARILDVGTGVGGLAVALAKRFAESTVLGIDPWGACARARTGKRRLRGPGRTRHASEPVGPGARGSRRLRPGMAPLVLHPRARSRRGHRPDPHAHAARRDARRRRARRNR